MIKVKLRKNNLQGIRQYRDLTQLELAVRAKVSCNLIQKIERDNYCPSFRKRLQIANALEFFVKDIFILDVEEDIK